MPLVVIVTVGRDAWRRARNWNTKGNDFFGLVWTGEKPPNAYRWPVDGCACVIEWDIGPSADQIADLIRTLIGAGAESVTTWPRFVDSETPAYRYDTSKPPDERWVQVREQVRTFRAPGTAEGRDVE